jgi:hypothetical protein
MSALTQIGKKGLNSPLFKVMGLRGTGSRYA